MIQAKSPFYVVREFISPLMCEDIIDMCNFTIPDIDKDGKAVKTFKRCEPAAEVVYERFRDLVPKLQVHYGLEHKGMEQPDFEWLSEGSSTKPQGENSVFVRGQWLRVKPADLTCVLFLSDYSDTVPFEQEYEVYGGKLEFPQHKFGFNPERGTLIVFPSDPHFINLTSEVVVGDLYQARFNVVAKTPYLYQPNQFPGNYLSWFKDI